MQLDLASQASIRVFVDEFTRRFDRLDVLVSNAGVASPERRLTVDGFELHLGVHNLGPFLLTTLLLPVLEASAPSRVVVVVGSAKRNGRIAWDDLQSERRYSLNRASGQSRLANLLFVRELARRVHGITVNALDPGLASTGISRDLPLPMRVASRLLSGSPEKGARTYLCLATSLDVARVMGKYFMDRYQIKTNPRALDDDAAQRLWDLSDELTAATSAPAP